MSTLVALPEPAALSVGERLSGHLAVGLARLLITAAGRRPRLLAQVLLLLGQGTRPATAVSARRAHRIVETVSLRCAGPYGCMPRSVAIVLLCRSRGQRVTWRVGVHSPPARTHAWVEAGGEPVGEPFDPRLLYVPVIET